MTFKKGDIVITTYGRGIIKSIRSSDDMLVITPLGMYVYIYVCIYV